MYTCVYILHRTNSLLGTKLGFFPSPFHISAISRLTLAEAFRNNHVATCSTALRSATEGKESDGYVTPFRVRPKWHSIVAERTGLNSSEVTRLVTAEHIQNKYSFSM